MFASYKALHTQHYADLHVAPRFMRVNTHARYFGSGGAWVGWAVFREDILDYLLLSGGVGYFLES